MSRSQVKVTVIFGRFSGTQ